MSELERIEHGAVDAETYFWSRVQIGEADECWPWMKARHKANGYGLLRYEKRCSVAHRVSWTVTHGPIPDGLCVLHRCDNPPCVNPAHLFLGTQRDNVMDMIAKGRWRNVIAEANRAKTHCVRGHELADANVYVGPLGKRQCRVCAREADRRRYPLRYQRKRVA